MLENCKEVLDKGDSVSAVFMVIGLIAFDTLNLDLLIAKLEAYSFSAKTFSQEFLKDLFLVHFYSMYILLTFSFFSMKHF